MKVKITTKGDRLGDGDAVRVLLKLGALRPIVSHGLDRVRRIYAEVHFDDLPTVASLEWVADVAPHEEVEQ